MSLTVPGLTRDAGANWQALMDREYAVIAGRLTTAYARTTDRLQPAQDALIKAIDTKTASGVVITAEVVRGMDEYTAYLAQVEAEFNDYAALVREVARDAVESGISIGIESALIMSILSAGDAGDAVRAEWVSPPLSALQQMISIVDSEAFRAQWNRYGEAVAEGIADTMIRAFATKANTDRAARLIRDYYDIPLAWAENTTRTAQLWSWRLSSHTGYAVNDNIVSGWMWWSSRDTTTCPSCWAKHGELHTHDEVLNDHHRGRCTPLPVVRGATWINDVITGPDEFATLPQATQDEIFRNNRALQRALTEGAVSWGDISRPYDDAVYGQMQRVASLRELLGRNAKTYYVSRGA